MTYIIASSDLSDGLSGRTTRKRLLLLMRSELEGTTQTLPSRFSAGTTFASSGTNEFSLKFGEPAEYGQHEAAVKCGRIGPSIPQ